MYFVLSLSNLFLLQAASWQIYKLTLQKGICYAYTMGPLVFVIIYVELKKFIIQLPYPLSHNNCLCLDGGCVTFVHAFYKILTILIRGHFDWCSMCSFSFTGFC